MYQNVKAQAYKLCKTKNIFRNRNCGKLSYIIRITVFSLDDKVVFGDILFFWLIFSTFLRNERRGVLVGAETEAGGRRLGRRRKSGAAASAAARTKTPRRSFRKNLQNISKINKISPKMNLSSNGNTVILIQAEIEQNPI